MQIVIHRGTHQIGGCVTEIDSNGAKVFIDFGSNLPGHASQEPSYPIAGLTVSDGSKSALFLTHYHGDHVGRLGEVLPGLPIYMGKTAKALYLNYAQRIHSANLPLIESIHSFMPLGTVRIGDISVTPLMIDHSAFDAYMFVIEAEGKRILHTGDFRLHGFRGEKSLHMLRRYASDIDYLICESTTLSRGTAPCITERELQHKAKILMQGCPYVFVFCSSTNIDRIAAFYHANPLGRLFLCDQYQKKQLELVQMYHAKYSKFYDFQHLYSYAPNLDERMEKQGFCMIVRQGAVFSQLLQRYQGRSRVIYSMWDGYLKGNTRNEALAAFMEPYHPFHLHTSGHAGPQDLVRLCQTVCPKHGLIPIHGEMPEHFRKLLPDRKVIILQDEEKLQL